MRCNAIICLCYFRSHTLISPSKISQINFSLQIFFSFRFYVFLSIHSFFCVHLLTSTHTRLDKKYSKHTNNWKITKTKLKCTRTKRSSNNSKQNRDRKRIIYNKTIDNHSNFSKQKRNFRTFSLCVFIDKLFPLHHHTDELKMNKNTFRCIQFEPNFNS